MSSHPEKAARTSRGMDSFEGGPRHVLVVDDNAAIRRLLGRLLHLRGFTALEAASIAEATASADQHDLRAIVVDLNLGAQSGVDLLVMLRQNPRCAAIPIVILTGQAEICEGDQALIRRNHARVFYKPEALASVVEHLARLGVGDNPAENRHVEEPVFSDLHVPA